MSNRTILRRILLALGGTAGVAFTTFVIAVLLVRTVSPAQFGIFSFHQVFVALGYGLSNALLGSPMMVGVNREGRDFGELALSFGRMSLLLGLLAGAATFGLVLSFGEDGETALAFALSSLFMLLRWFGRSLENTAHRPGVVLRSDLVFVLVMLGGCGWLVLQSAISLKAIAYLQLTSAVSGFVALGLPALRAHGLGLIRGRMAEFGAAFKAQGRHALAGVLATEATANAHVYLVTALLGPAAFAPLAAAVLLFRPVPLVIMSLTQLERPRIARMLADGDGDGARRAIRLFRRVVGGFWLFNVAFAAGVVFFLLDAAGLDDYDPWVIQAATAFWALIMGLRCLRGPESAWLQADGRFRELSRTMIVSGAIALPLVFAMLQFFEVVYSLAGVLAGELVAAALIMRLVRRPTR